jgi:iron complex transport system substrate-binding protein
LQTSYKEAVSEAIWPLFFSSNPLLMKSFSGLLLLLLFTACVNKGAKDESALRSAAKPDSSLTLRHATGFRVDYFPGYKRIMLADPWNKGAVLDRYYLVRDTSVKVPSDGIKVLIPLRRLVSASCTQYAFLEMLNELSSVAAVCDAKTVYNPGLRQALKAKKVTDLGDPFNMDMEACLMLRPQALIVNSFNQKDEHVTRIREAGIPVLYDNEWMEPDLLARAEWIRFLGCLFDKEMLADSLFRAVESRYSNLRNLVKTAKTPKPNVLSGDDFRGTWYLPGGRSFTAQLFRDAGASYQYQNDTTSGSKPFTFEQILSAFHLADVWVGVTNRHSLADLRAMDERYALFKAWRNGQVYAYTNRTTPEGGNDYWEGAVANPDRLLADFVKLFHPELLPGHRWYYLRKLQ